MINPMMQAINQSRFGQVRQLMGAVRAAQNPQAALGQLLNGNPAYRQISEILRQNGGDARAAFYSLAGQMGVDPAEILDALR